MKRVTAKAILIRARRLVKRGWIQGDLARGSYGEEITGPVKYTVSTAKCFCATAAIYRAAYELGGPVEEIDYPDDEVELMRFNDAPLTTKADVLAVLDWAIEAC